MKKSSASHILFSLLLLHTCCSVVAIGSLVYYGIEYKQQEKYLGGGKLEHIVFDVQQSVENTQDFIKRTGLLYINKDAPATVLICHGFMCDKFDVAFIRRTLFSRFNVMVFDFRAHGQRVDESQCCTFGKDEALDVMGVVKFLKSRPDINDLPLIAYGFSMGAVAAIQAQAQGQDLFKAMILDCPYDKSKNVLKKAIDLLNITVFGYTLPVPGKSLLIDFAFNPYVQAVLKVLLKTIARLDSLSINTKIYPLNPVESIKKINIPCFFIHCLHDEKVSVKAAESLYSNAAGFKRLWITNGRRHYDSVFFNPEKYIYKVNKFLDSILTGIYKQKNDAKIYRDKIVYMI